MKRMVAAVLASAGVVPTGYAQSAAALQGPVVVESVTVKTARLRLVGESEPAKLLSGWLYRIPLHGEQRRIAYVSEEGQLDQHYLCSNGDRLIAKPDEYVTSLNQSKPCRDGVEFTYQAAYTVGLEPASQEQHLGFGNYLAAYADYSSIFSKAAARTAGTSRQEYLTKARAAESALLAASAMALGDDKLERLVMRDPAQAYRLVLSEEGAFALRAFQREQRLPVTGKLDFPTITGIGRLQAPETLKSAEGRFLILPSDWANDIAVENAPSKSVGLIELKASIQGPR